MAVFFIVDKTFCIRNVHFSPFIAKNTLTCNSFAQAHKRVLEYCFNDPTIVTAMIFENDVEVTNDLTDAQHAEISRFLVEHKKWDILILGTNKIATTSAVPGFSHIVQSKNTSAWISDTVYIVSRRFMEKMTKNNRSMIFTFALSTPHISNVVHPSPLSLFNVGLVDNVVIEESINKHISYSWATIKEF